MSQEIKFTAQLDEAQQQIESHRSRIAELQNKISDLEKDLSARQWNVESELFCSYNVLHINC